MYSNEGTSYRNSGIDAKFNMLYSYSYSIHIRYRTSAYFIDKLTKVIRIDGGLKQIFSSE